MLPGCVGMPFIRVDGLHVVIVHPRHRLDCPVEQAGVELGELLGIPGIDF